MQTIDGAQAGVVVTAADRDRETALVRAEKRVALMIEMAGSWEKLWQVWTITFPAVMPPLREIQASAGRLFIRTFSRGRP